MRDKKIFHFDVFYNSAGRGVPTPITGCLFFIRDCDEALAVSGSEATNSSHNVISVLHGSRCSRCLSHYIPVDHISAESCGFRDSETQSADKVSLYVFTPLFFGAADEVTSRGVNECHAGSFRRSHSFHFHL
jgi:hypothetical protein